MADGILNPIEQLEAEIDFDVYTKQEVDALLDEKADKSDTYTKTETDALLDDKADADSVYTKTETDTLLSAKADKSTTLAGYGITDAYTKTQTDTLLNGKADADSVYTKQEIDTKIPSSVGSATKPVYVNGGVITECTYELNKTVPANAVFTDTTYTAGNGLNLIGTSFSAKAGANVSVDSGGINVNGNGVVASADSGLVSGGTAYTELRPTLDGTWVKNAQTTAINLQKLEGGIEYLYGLLSHQYDQLKKYINGNYYDYDTDTDSKYTKTVPQGAMPYASLDSVGGKTLVWNQLVDPSRLVSRGTVSSVGLTQTTDGNGAIIINGTSTQATNIYVSNTLPLIGGHKYIVYCDKYSADWYFRIGSSDLDTSNGAKIASPLSSGNVPMYFYFASGVTFDNLSVRVQYTDLTLLYGAGNEPSTVQEFQQRFPAVWYAYNPGSLLSAGVTEVVSKKADTTEIATYPIPAEIQALEGYGWSAGSVYNYVDFERKVFVKNVGAYTWDGTGWTERHTNDDGTKTYSRSVAEAIPSGYIVNANKLKQSGYADGYVGGVANMYSLGAGLSVVESSKKTVYLNTTDISATNLTLLYALSTPQETDISAYLTDDNLIEVEAGGTLTFPNSNGTDYQIPVPSAETYMVDLQSAI